MDSKARRWFLAAIAFLVLGFGQASQVVASDLSFLVVGDWGKGSVAQRKVAFAMAEAAEAANAHFVISTGDNFYSRGVKSVLDPEWEKGFEDVYTDTALMIPWYITLGNHDHRGNVSAQVDYTNFRWRLPYFYYKHTEEIAEGSTVDFFHLDTVRLLKGDKAQEAWFKRELESSKAAWKIVIGHHPLYSGGTHGNTEELIALLKPLFEQFGVQVYLNGHCHDLERVVVGNVNYLTSGAGSDPSSAKPIQGTKFVRGNQLGFVSASLSPTEMKIQFLDETGRTLYQSSIPAHPSPIATNSEAAKAPAAY
jgi:tartrate-resistant acid phosphatase type 5